MKKTLLATLLGFSILMLTGCSTVGFDSVKLGASPLWDMSVPNSTDAWGNKDFTTNDRGEVQPAYIKLYNSDKSCYIDGRIVYDSVDNIDNGDKKNSEQYIEGYGKQSVAKIPFVTGQTTINDVRYIVAEYTLPKTFGEYRYHKTAVRVFSSNVEVPYQVDQKGGLPMVIIDLACKNEKDISDETWEESSKFFKLNLEDVKKQFQKVEENTEQSEK